MIILTLNAGSSSLKFKLFDFGDEVATLLDGQVDAIGQDSACYKFKNASGEKTEQQQPIADHAAALSLIGKTVTSLGLDIDGIAHRVVHGGTTFNEPAVITAEVIEQLRALIPLAPLHNPANILGIETATTLFPKAKQISVFDTAFHQTMPATAYTYAIDRKLADELHIRRYGFHGTSHDYVSQEAAKQLGKDRDNCQFISCHLGNGASLCAIKDGKSIDTSMGMTPLAGLVMGTRCGDIDPAVVVYLQGLGHDAATIDRMLNKESGLKGLCSSNDMRDIEAMAESGNADAQLALDCFVYRVQQYIGAYLTQLPSCDGVIFTGGIGENSSYIRDAVIKPLAHLGIGEQIPVMVIETNEELQMASFFRRG